MARATSKARAAPRKRAAPVHYEMDLEPSARPISLDARSLTLPSLAVIGLVASFVWGTYIIVNERNRLDGRIGAVITSVERLAESVERLTQIVATNTSSRYTRADHDTWCKLAESVNKGFKCPALPQAAVIPLDSHHTNAGGIRDTILKGIRKGEE